MAVKVILRDDIAKLGHAGDLVSVKPGYARNFLIPKGKAIFATAAKVKELEHHRRIIAENMAKQLKDLNAAKDRLEQLRLEIEAKAGEEGKLFGSITSIQIAELAAQKGVEIDRRKIDLKEPIKQLGDHEVPVKLHRQVVAMLKLKVTAEPQA